MDVQGAFDRVDGQLLLRKLSSLGLNVQLLKGIHSRLRDRMGCVIIISKKSHPATLRNTVYQGTVWGPSLWNGLYYDFDIVIHAGDCNACKRHMKQYIHKIYKIAPTRQDRHDSQHMTHET